MFKRLKKWWQHRYFYVIADSQDNSVTLSKKVYQHLNISAELSEAKVFVFFIPDSQCYGFMLNPDMDKPTQLCDIQYNSKHKCIGFETLCPSVGKMFYSYGLGPILRCKLSVSAMKTKEGKVYYQIEKPHAKYSR